MTHLSFEALNLYIDAQLGAAERAAADAHLAGCAECQAALARLERTLGALAGLPPVRIPVDLSAAVLAQVRPRRQGRLVAWALLAAQLGATLALLIVLGPHMLAPLGAGTLAPAGLWRMPLAGIARLDLPPGVPLAGMSMAGLALIFGGAAIIWLVGNRLLLGAARDHAIQEAA